jgi:hypothetical protein
LTTLNEKYWRLLHDITLYHKENIIHYRDDSPISALDEFLSIVDKMEHDPLVSLIKLIDEIKIIGIDNLPISTWEELSNKAKTIKQLYDNESDSTEK